MTCKVSRDFFATSKLTAHSSRRNQISSPPLRLPAELRNKVYEYALGGWDIHIQYGGTSIVDESQQETDKDNSKAGLVDSKQRMCAACWPASDVERPCITAHKAVLNLPSVCRQLNAETKMLPFTLNNEFSLDDQSLRKFYHRLHEAQRSRLTKLRIFLVDYDYYIDGGGDFSLSRIDRKKVLGNFFSLEKLVLEAALCFPWDYDWKHLSETLTQELVEWLKTSTAHRQQALGSKTVEVTIEPVS
jgi:hypothetical protein